MARFSAPQRFARRGAVVWAAAVILLAAGCAEIPREPFAESVERVVATGKLKATVDRLAQPLIDSGRNIGMVIGVATPAGDGLFAYGYRDREGREPMTVDQTFQIGSVSKSFTALLAAELEREGKLRVDDPVDTVLPRDMPTASPAMRRITFAELASHTSGLGHEAYTMDLLWGVVTYLVSGKSLYRFYNTGTLESWIQTHDLTAPTTKAYGYSNIGPCYLGWLLGQVDHLGYATSLKRKVLAPLGLTHTGISLPEDDGRNLTPGYAGDLPTFVPRHTPVDPWLFDEGIAGTGGLYSTAADLLVYAKANMGTVPTPLYPAMARTHAPRAPIEDGQVAMAWFLKTLPDTRQPYTYIAGIVGGHTSFVGFDERRHVAVVVLQNSINHDDMIGTMLLDRLVGVEMALHAEAPVPPVARLERDQYSK